MKIYFPLIGNCGWFGRQDLRSLLGVRLKQSLLLYDEILIEDGTFVGWFSQDDRMVKRYPPGSLTDYARLTKWPRPLASHQMVNSADGETAELVAGSRSPIVAAYSADFFEWTSAMKGREWNFVRRVYPQGDMLPASVVNEITEATTLDTAVLQRVVRKGPLAHFIAGNLNIDIAFSALWGATLVTDSRHAKLLARKSALPTRNIGGPAGHDARLRTLLNVAMPNVERMSLQAIGEMRHDRSWLAFRAFLVELSQDARDQSGSAGNTTRLRRHLDGRLARALFAELRRRFHTGRSLTVNMALGLSGLIPIVGIAPSAAAMAKSAADYWRDRNGWLAFVMRNAMDG